MCVCVRCVRACSSGSRANAEPGGSEQPCFGVGVFGTSLTARVIIPLLKDEGFAVKALCGAARRRKRRSWPRR